ncbi:hypothetical protein [Streptomyces canus]|uniref:hypothetical protein n=1 Tax=Streptomyces canus TaxID=58343 RepID=UPI002E363F07|nr:hypothetical protein [Streptomyces canus]
MTEPDEGETKVRAALHRLGARPAGHAPAGDAERQPAPVPVRPEYKLTVPGPRRASAPRLPDWWSDRKPDVPVDGPADDQEEVDEKPEEHGRYLREPSGQSKNDHRSRLLWLLKGEREDEQHDADGDEDEEHADQREESEEDGEEDLDEVRRVGEGRGRKSQAAAAPAGRPRFSTPAPPARRRT